MKRVFGLETEYGITLGGAESVDVVAESIELVRHYTDHGALMKWDYDLEDPHLDARGFRARELLQDTDESAYYEIDKRRPLSFEEVESGQSELGVYQISQRADFFSVVVSIDTMNRRPLVNTRDEPHVDASRYRRFHVILGDSNMSEWATAMKIGTTALVLDLIERGEAPQLEIAQPVDANRSISRDQTYDWIIELKDGRKISAIDVQRVYLRAAARVEDGMDEDRE